MLCKLTSPPVLAAQPSSRIMKIASVHLYQSIKLLLNVQKEHHEPVSICSFCQSAIQNKISGRTASSSSPSSPPAFHSQLLVFGKSEIYTLYLPSFGSEYI